MNLSAFGIARDNVTAILEIAMEIANRIRMGHMFAIITMAICTPLFLLQLSSLPIFLIHRNYRRNVCFRILFSNGFCECLELGTLMIFAILNLSMSEIDMRMQHIGGAIVIPAWSLVVIQHVLLSSNRLVVIMRARYLGSRYIPDEEQEATIFNILHVFVWSLYVAVVALFLSPYVGSIYNRKISQFAFDPSLPYTQFFRDVNWYLTCILPAICFCLYLVIIYMAKMSRRTIQQTDHIASGVNTSPKSGGTAPLLNDYERRLLIQAIILYTLMALIVIAFNAFNRCNEFTLVCYGRMFGIFHTQVPLHWHFYLIETPWMIYCGINPVLFLTMNKEFRSRYVRLYTRRSPDQISQIFTNTLSTLLSCSGDSDNDGRENGTKETTKSRRKAISLDAKKNGHGQTRNGNGLAEATNEQNEEHQQKQTPAADNNNSNKRKMTAAI